MFFTGISIYNFPRSGRIGPVKSPWVVKKSNADEDDLLKHYNRNVDYEASILRGLDHPNIIGFRATASGLSGESCLAMEKLHISLGTLKKICFLKIDFTLKKCLFIRR